MILSGSPDPAELARARRAIANIESRGSGGYSALGPVIDNPRSQFYGDRAYGAYQVMGRNVGPWTRKVFGREMTPEQFLADPQAQDALFDAMFGPVMASAGPEGAASWWFTGSTTPRNVSDTLGTTANEYQRRFIREFGNSGNEPMANGMSAPYTPPAAGTAAQPAGLLPQPARRPSIWSDPETWESIALALNPLRTNPDPNLAQQIEGRRASRTDERRRNMTAQWLRSQGMTQYADLVEGGMMAGDEALRMAMTPAESGGTVVTGAQLMERFGVTGVDQNALFNVSADGKITPVVAGPTSVVNVGAGGSEFGPVPADYRRVTDAEGNVYLELLPGSETAREREQEARDRETAFLQAQDRVALINKLIENPAFEGGVSPGLRDITGFVEGRLPPMTQAGVDANAILNQIKGQAFLQAVQALVGMGALSNMEGQAATDAQARLDRAQSEKAMVDALTEFRTIIERGMRRLEANGGTTAPPSAAAPPTPGAGTPGMTREDALKILTQP